MNTTPANKTLLLLAFFAIYFIWGTTYLAILFGLDSMEPFVLSTWRYLLAGLLLLGWSAIRKHSLPAASIIKVAGISGMLMLVGGSGLVVLAEKYIGSGHAAVVIATEPLWFLLLDKKRWSIYFFNPFIIAGLLIGFAGITLFAYFTPDSDTHSSSKFLGTVITLLGSVLWVVGTLYSDRNKQTEKHPHIMITGIQLLAGGLLSALIALLLGEWNGFSPDQISTKAWGGLLFLVIMGSVVAYLAFTWLVKVQPPALVSTHTYVNPIVAVLIGWLFANEQITILQLFALVLVLTGVLLTRVNNKQVH